MILGLLSEPALIRINPAGLRRNHRGDMIAAPLAGFVPPSALAGVLVVVCWNMAEKANFLRLLKEWRGASMLLATFAMMLAADLITGIVAGYVLVAGLFICGAAAAREGHT